MKTCIPVIVAMVCCAATGCLGYRVQKPLATFPGEATQSIVVPARLPKSKVSWWFQLRTPKQVTPVAFAKTRVRIQVTNVAKQPVQLFFLQRAGIVLAAQQSAIAYDSVWEGVPVQERLFGCQTMYHPSDLRLEFIFEPKVRLADGIQLTAVKSDAF